MATPKRSFVVSYNEEDDKLTVCTLSQADLAPLIASAVKADWPLASIHHELTDEVALRLGVTALSVLAVHHPALQPMLKVTPLEVPPPPST